MRYFILVAVIIFSGSAYSASQSTWSYNGVCYDNSNDVLTAFTQSFPFFAGGHLMQLNTTAGYLPTINAPVGQISYNIYDVDLGVSGLTYCSYTPCTITNNGLTAFLPPCTYHYRIQDYVAAMWLMLPFVGGYIAGLLSV